MIDTTENKRAEDGFTKEGDITGGGLLVDVSHDFRAPLDAIIAFADLLLGSDLTDEQRDFVQSIMVSSEVLDSLVNDILDHASSGAGKPVICPIGFSLRQMVEDLVRVQSLAAARKGLSLAVEVAPDIEDELVGDADRIRRVLLNLIDNAIKYTGLGGITIAVGARPGAEGPPELHFGVSDTGIGISREQQHKIFNKFARVGGDADAGRGTGLGLYISSELARLMGGRIWVESEQGRGSTFHFTVPLQTAPPERALKPATRLASSGEDKLSIGRTLRILVVEDHDLSRKVAMHVLIRQNQHVTVAADGKEALGLWKRGSFDLILMDTLIPEMDGYETAAEIRRLEKNTGSHIPIIAVATRVLADDERKSLAAGMDGYLAKPITERRLVEAIVGVTSTAAKCTDSQSRVGASSRSRHAIFDWQSTLGKYDGDEAFVKSLILDVLTSCPEQVAKLRQAHSANDIERLRFIAHDLAGSLTIISAPNARKEARKLERMAISGRYADLEPVLSRLEVEIAALRHALRARLSGCNCP